MRLLIAFLFCLITAPIFANPFTFDDAFVRETPMKISAGYVTITNTGKDDVLVGASADWAGKIELHDVKVDDTGVLTMSPLAKLPIKADQSEALAPSGRHLMIYDIKTPIKTGEVKTITLHFKNAGDVKTDFTVKPITYRGKNADVKTNASKPDDPHHGMHH